MRTTIKTENVLVRMQNGDLEERIREHQAFLESDGAEGAVLEIYSAKIEDFDFSGLNLNSVLLQGNYFSRCNFRSIDLFGADLRLSTFEHCDFRVAMLAKTVWHRCSINDCDFTGANLQRAEIINAEIASSTFESSNFSGIVVSGCNIKETLFKVSELGMSAIEENQETNVTW